MNLLLAALAPVITIIIYIYVKDKYEKESIKLLFFNFLMGGVISILVSTVLYMFYNAYIPKALPFSVQDQFVKAFFIVACIEEFSKYIVVRYYAQPKKDFNEPFDGIIYAVMVSMGFAAVENIMYVFNGGLEVAFLRALTAVPAHATFGVLMGYFMGIAKFSGKHRVKWNLVGLLLAILFHGSYDFFMFINFIPGISAGAFVSLIIGVILSKRAIKAHQKNSYFK